MTAIIDNAIGKLKTQVDKPQIATAASRAAPQAAPAGAPPPAPSLDGQHGGQIAVLRSRSAEMDRALEQVQQRLSETEALLGRHDAGLVQPDSVVCGLSAARQSGPQQLGFGTAFGADFNGGAATGTGASRALQAEEYEFHSLGEPRWQVPWKLYDE